MSRSITIADIAKKTGLSRATVDRVINLRGNVKEDTRSRVESAIAELKYSTTRLSSMIGSVARHVEVILVEGTNPFFRELTRSIKAAMEEDHAGTFSLRMFDPYHPETLLERLAEIDPKADAVIMVGVDNPEVTQAVDRLLARNVRVITLVSGMSSADNRYYVGQDNFQSGRTAGRLMAELVGDEAGKIAILIGHLQFRHLLDRRSGFEQVLGMKRPDLTPLHIRPYGGDGSQFQAVLDDLVTNHPDLKGIYLCGGGQPQIFAAIKEADLQVKFVAHEVTEVSRRALSDGVLNAVVASDMVEIGQQAVRAAMSETPPQTRPSRINIYFQENLPPQGEPS